MLPKSTMQDSGNAQSVGAIGAYLIEEFVSLQKEKQTAAQSVETKAARIVKHISNLQSSSSQSKNKKSKQNTKSESHSSSGQCLDNEADEEVSEILLQYLDSALAATENGDSNANETEEDNAVEIATSDKLHVVENLLELIAAIACMCGGKKTRSAVVKSGLEYSTVLLIRVRKTAVKLLGSLGMFLAKTQSSFGDDEEKQVILQREEISKAILQRLTDKAAPVRGAAIVAAGLVLQAGEATISPDITEAEEFTTDLLEALLWNVWHESSVANRILAIKSVPLSPGYTEATIDHLITRLRDVKEKVRVAAVQALNQISLSALNSTHMAEIIQCGLAARCPATQHATEKLVCVHWMKSSKFSLVNLLKKVDVLAHENEAARIIRAIAACVIPDDVGNKTEHLASLSPPEIRAYHEGFRKEFTGWWKEETAENHSFELETLFVAATLSSNTANGDNKSHIGNDFLSQTIPDIAYICDVFHTQSSLFLQAIDLQESSAEDRACFICLQLLSLATVSAAEEEGSRRRLASLLKALLSNLSTPDDLIEGAVTALRTAHQFSDSASIEAVEEILTLLHAKGEEDCTVPRAADHSNLCTLRMLSILSIFLEHAPSNAPLRTFLRRDVCEGTIVRAIANSQSNLVREAGVSCLGKMGLYIDSTIVLDEYRPLLLKIAGSSETTLAIRGQALIALMDWAMIYGEAVVQPVAEGSDDKHPMALKEIVNEFLHLPNASAVAIAAEAAAKLVFSGRMCDSTLIGNLLVLFFSPLYESLKGEGELSEVGNMARVQQLLSLFFPALALQSKIARTTILNSVGIALQLATLQDVGGKKRKGKSSHVFPLVRMVEYVCEIVITAAEEILSENTSQIKGVEDSAQRNHAEEEHTGTAMKVALALAQFLCTDAENSLNATQRRGLCKLLGSLQVVSINENGQVCEAQIPDLQTLEALLEDLSMVLSDSVALRALDALRAELSEVGAGSRSLKNGGSSSKERYSDASTVTEVSLKSVTKNSQRYSNASTVTEMSVKSEVDSEIMGDKENQTGNPRLSTSSSKGEGLGRSIRLRANYN